MLGDVEPGRGHVGHLVLGLRHHHGHVGAAHELDQRLQVRALQLRRARQPVFEFGQVAGPLGLDQVVHAHRGGLVDGHVHGLAPETPVDEMVDQILGDLDQALGPGDQLVLLGEAARHRLLLGVVERSLLQEVLQLVVEVVVCELQLGDAVLVVERDGGPVGDGVAEVVDRHVVAEHPPGLLLAGDERCAGEPEERGVGQRQAHVRGHRVVLGAVGLVSDDHDVGALGQHRHPLALLGRDELVDQREHVPVVLAQQLAQMGRRLSVDLPPRGDHPRIGEVPVELLVELLAVGDQHERPVAGLLAQHLLGEPQHRQRLARPLRVPEHPQPALTLLQLPQRLQRVVHPKELMVLGERLHQATGTLGERHEVLDQVEQPMPLARSPQRSLQRHHTLLALRVDLLPLSEVIPGSERRANQGVGPVGEHHERVEPEQVRHRVAVVAQVPVVRVAHVLVRHLQLDEDQRDAIDEQHDVGPALVHVASDPELRNRQPVVRIGTVPVDETHRNRPALPIAADGLDPRPLAEQSMDLPVRPNPIHRRPIFNQPLSGLLKRLIWQARVQIA